MRHKNQEEVICDRCGGSGKYEETERPPYTLQFIMNAQGELQPKLSQYLDKNLAGQLALTTIRLPIMSKLVGTLVQQTGNMIQIMQTIPRSIHASNMDYIPRQRVVEDTPGTWHAFLGTASEIDRADILLPIENWIRTLRPQWKHLKLRKLKKKKSNGAERLPSYFVSVDARCAGARSCAYHNSDLQQAFFPFCYGLP